MLRELRAASGQKLRTVAAAADMDPSVLSKIELGQRFPTAEQSVGLARHFGVPAARLEAARMEEEVLKKMAANPEAATLFLERIEESACEYRVSKMSTAVDKPASAVSKRRKRD